EIGRRGRVSRAIGGVRRYSDTPPRFGVEADANVNADADDGWRQPLDTVRRQHIESSLCSPYSCEPKSFASAFASASTPNPRTLQAWLAKVLNSRLVLRISSVI